MKLTDETIKAIATKAVTKLVYQLEKAKYLEPGERLNMEIKIWVDHMLTKDDLITPRDPESH